MALTSSLLSKDTRIQQAYRDRNRPIAFGEAQSQSVARVQVALTQVGYSMPKSVSTGGADGIFGDETLATVRQFQADNGLRVDGMIGEHTLDALDAALNRLPAPPPAPPLPPPAPDHDAVIQTALRRSRAAVHMALARLMALQGSIEGVDKLNGPQKIAAIVAMTRAFPREIAVVSKRLLVSQDALTGEFRDALDKAISLIRLNQAVSSNIKDDGVTGRCDPKNFQPPGTPFGATNADQPDPRVSVCQPFFDTSLAFTAQDLQRDVITHEFFHLVGLDDVTGVDTTEKALRNANTLAQIVAWIVDRHRQKNSDGNEAAIPPLPSP